MPPDLTPLSSAAKGAIVKTPKTTLYSLHVASSYWKRIEDGTLWTLKRIDRQGQALAGLYRAEPTGFLHILPGDIRTSRLDDYKPLLADDDQWQTFERDKLVPCFLYEANFHPFEAPALDREARDSVSVCPARIIELSLETIEHRFPGGTGEPGDKDVRDLTTAQTFLFRHNYARLNLYRRQSVQRWLRLALAMFAIWAWWGLEAVTTGGPRPLHAVVATAFAYAGFDLAGAPAMVRAVLSPLTVAVLTLCAFFVMQAWTQHIQNLHRLRFLGATRGASTAVTKALTARLDNLLYLTRGLLEEIDRGKEDAWDRDALKPWAQDVQKLAALVFWCDQRIAAIEAFVRVHMKLIGLCNDGVGDEARFKALVLVCRNATIAMLLPVGFAAAGALCLGWRPAGFALASAAGLDLTCFALVAASFTVLLLRLHGLIKTQESRESIEALINWPAIRAMRGYRDSQLYREIAAFITREKRRLLREEEKYGGNRWN